MDFEKNIIDGIERIESVTAENLKLLLETTKENTFNQVSKHFIVVLVTDTFESIIFSIYELSFIFNNDFLMSFL